MCVVFRCVDSGESQLVLQRFQNVVDLLQDFRDHVRLDWSRQLDSDCGFILEQPLIQHSQQGMLEVNCSHKVSQKKDVAAASTHLTLLLLPGRTGAYWL